ncbi:unnamed protein product [Kluyveromyces dobzhanskii CBS 2104]|uniref:WGS project CCBQ000000000 data, contig 00106 n=1 Tax=Kluyveromyces dobzhanskii CBS 2104 TaxID=1427455 RepID=A0A0A8L857_9SACH|nr:unnamed protein product [Kluyveromyces dobzhanskii CBS 2104]
MNAVNTFVESVAENSYAPTVTVTETITSTTTGTATAFTTVETASTTDSLVDVNKIKGYLNSYINSTLELNYLRVNDDIAKRLIPLTKSAVQNWNNSFNNMQVLLNNTRSNVSTLHSYVIADLENQSNRLNSSVASIKELGLFVASSAEEAGALNDIYVDLTNTTEGFSSFENALNNFVNLSPVSLPNISFTDFDTNITSYPDLVTSLMANISTALQNQYKSSQKRVDLKKRQSSVKASKCVTLTVIFLCIYPTQVIGVIIVEWFSHVIKRNMILVTLDEQLNDIEEKKNTLQRYNHWKPKLFELCESVENPLTVKTVEFCLEIAARLGMRKEINANQNFEVVNDQRVEKKCARLTWWFYNSCLFQLYLLLLILMAWIVVSSLIPTSYSASLKKRELESNFPATRVSVETVSALCESFDDELNTEMENAITAFYSSSVNESLKYCNDRMSSIVSNLTTQISDYVPWESIPVPESTSNIKFNTSGFILTYLSSFNSSHTSLTDANAILLKREQTISFNLKFHINKLFKNSILIWGCIHIVQLVICIVF